MRPIRIEDPVGDVLPVDDDLRLHLRVDHSEEDAILQSYVSAAVQHLDAMSGRLGRCILRQRWALPVPAYGLQMILPFPDCRELSVGLRDDAGAFTPVTPVTMSRRGDCLRIDGLPANRDEHYLLCTAGWDAAANVPAPIQQAIRMLVAHWYEMRGAATTGYRSHSVPMGFEMLIAPWVHRAI